MIFLTQILLDWIIREAHNYKSYIPFWCNNATDWTFVVLYLVFPVCLVNTSLLHFALLLS